MGENPLSSILGAATGGMRAQSERLRVISENIANADTPGYRRKLISFDREMQLDPQVAGRIGAARVTLSGAERERIHEPGHPLADETGYYTGSNVDLVVEIADAREAQRSYEANLRLFEQAREMSRNLFDLLRR